MYFSNVTFPVNSCVFETIPVWQILFFQKIYVCFCAFHHDSIVFQIFAMFKGHQIIRSLGGTRGPPNNRTK